mmetsp:Transcript_95862/g.184217  ORF Transcript_95862/g.184217 Transcript_95862/m.184217 type:complete len:150 (-) Transcript_95862:4-453(-)
MAEEASKPIVSDTPAEETPAVEAPAEPMTKIEALKKVLSKAREFDGLKKGLHEVAKALDSGKARLCCLAADVDVPHYPRLVQALCTEQNVPLIMVDEGMELGTWCGLCKLDADGVPRKTVRCSSAAITDWGLETAALDVLRQHLKGVSK